MNSIVSSIFCVLSSPHEGNIITIDQIDYCVSSTQLTSIGTLVPLIGDNLGHYESVGACLFKISSLNVIFPQLPPPKIPLSSSKDCIHMISLDTCGPHRPLDPWVISPDLIEFDQASEHPPPYLV